MDFEGRYFFSSENGTRKRIMSDDFLGYRKFSTRRSWYWRSVAHILVVATKRGSKGGSSRVAKGWNRVA